MKNVTYLNLTGGLGNQLFQLAAALSLGESHQIFIETTNGKPRSNSTGQPEISSFTLPDRVSFLERTGTNWLSSKATGYVLRSGITTRHFEKVRILRFMIRLAASVINSVALKSRVKVNVNSGVGYDKYLKQKRFQLLIGYFQTYRYASMPAVYEELKNLTLVTQVDLIEEYRKLALVETPLVVHIRLGDYKLEESFGLLSKEYYSDAITELWSSGKYQKIWLFSDEPELAIQVIGDKYQDFVRIVPEVNDSAAATLEVMRSGSGYVIANSSFSWWAAFLSHTKNPVVLAPSPWFIGQEEPIDLIPPSWSRRNGHL
jgi:hypothetical protein